MNRTLQSTQALALLYWILGTKQQERPNAIYACLAFRQMVLLPYFRLGGQGRESLKTMVAEILCVFVRCISQLKL
jgi:hypothetical protein